MTRAHAWARRPRAPGGVLRRARPARRRGAPRGHLHHRRCLQRAVRDQPGWAPHGAAPSAPRRPRRAQRDHVARVPAARRAGRHRRAARPGPGRVRRPRAHGGLLLSDGVRRRVVAHGRRGLARTLRHRPRRPARPGLPARRRHRQAGQGRLAGAWARGLRPSRRLPRAPGRPVDEPPRRRAVPRHPRPRHRGGVVAGPSAPALRARDHARRLPIRQRHVPPRRPRPPGRHRGLGDGDGGRPSPRPRVGHPGLARRGRGAHHGELRRLHGHAVAHRAPRLLLAPRAGATPTRSTTTSSWPASSWPWSSRAATPASWRGRRTTRRWRRSAMSCSTWRRGRRTSPPPRRCTEGAHVGGPGPLRPHRQGGARHRRQPGAGSGHGARVRRGRCRRRGGQPQARRLSGRGRRGGVAWDAGPWPGRATCRTGTSSSRWPTPPTTPSDGSTCSSTTPGCPCSTGT